MISLHLIGGLGNQLFQIFNCMAYAIRFKEPFKIPVIKQDTASAEGHDRPTYWNTFLKRLMPFLIKDIKPDTLVFREKTFQFVYLKNKKKLVSFLFVKRTLTDSLERIIKIE